MSFFTSPEIIPFIGAFMMGIACIISVIVYDHHVREKMDEEE